MSAADQLAELKTPATPAKIVTIFRENGLPLKVEYGGLVAPKGITPDMANLLATHEAGIVAALTKKETVKDADRTGS
jgi:hypothetical protein